MASFQMHLAVAKVYMEYYPIKNKKDFISGVLDPDLKETKTISHYSDEIKNDTVREIIKAKVNLKKYLEKNKIDSDYKKGEFLHLLTDYDFFNNFIDEEYKNLSHNIFMDNIYYSYDILLDDLIKKYPVDTFSYQEILEEKIKNKKSIIKSKNLQNILKIEKVEQWINKLGQTNIEEIAEKILNS